MKMLWIALISLFFFAQAKKSNGDSNLIRVNFDPLCEANVTQLIGENLAATYQYIAKSAHFRAYDSEYQGMALMFMVHAREKLNDAKHLLKYLVHRGAEPSYEAIPAPPVTDWTHPTAVIEQALNIEKEILKHIILTHTCAQEHHDPDLMHDMADRMIVGEENTIFELGSYIAHLQHDGANEQQVLPIVSKKMYQRYKDYKDCFHAVDDPIMHDY